MFPMLFDMGLEIGYAYTSFRWENNARRNAGVTVVVINLRTARRGPKFLYTDGLQSVASNINGYLADAPSVFVYRRTRPLSGHLPRMVLGSMPKDGGNLVLNVKERQGLLAEAPDAARFVKRYMGSAEFINDIERYCLWIKDGELGEARAVPTIARRLEAVREWRSDSIAATTAEYAAFPNRFKQVAYKPTESIIVPAVSSERREYIPIGYVGAGTVVSNLAFVVYDAEPWLFSLLTSRLHNVWVRAVAGQLETRIRYGAYIVYNNFPVPPLTTASKQELTEAALRLLDLREYHSEKTLAELYDPELMPHELRRCHQEIDDLVESLYRTRPFETDEDRLSLLFGLYERMLAEEESR